MKTRKDYYHVKKLKENVYRITSKESVFCDLLVGTEKALLLDTGYGFGDLHAVVKKITNKPLFIVNSHGHVDHVSANGQFNETIYLHEKDFELCRQHTSSEFRKGSIENAKASMDYTTGQIRNILPVDFDEEAYLEMGTGKIIPVKEGDVFKLGGITLRVVEVPGHTNGSIGLIYEEENWLYAGDAMGSFLWLFAEEATTLSVYIETLKKAIGLNCDKFLIGHHPDLLDSKYLENILDCATHVDYSKGIPFKNPIIQGYEARICANGEIRMDKIGDPDFPMIVISESKIDC
ncbi:MBL fold metallo-hydrolase [Neobacillus vireti]|uniref:MBL fold metallo-hydrolase n=1 Tax=Neobacillus vireti TaxID=220686 RepID=UPI002FFFC0AE